MKQKILAIFFLFLVSLSPALATTYVIEHDDEVDQVVAMQERSAGRQDYNTELASLRQEVEDLRTQYAQQESDRIARDYYSGLRRGYNNRCDDDDLDDLDDLLDDNDLSSDERRDLRRLLDRCEGDDYFDDDFDYYDRYCDIDVFDYADNFYYGDYLDDAHRSGYCRRLYLREEVFDDYFDDFEGRYRGHDTSYNPYEDVLHELDDADFYKYGPGAYKEWGAWCESNRYTDGHLPLWCYERRRFITDVEWY